MARPESAPPPDNGWDSDTVTSFPEPTELPAPPRAVPAVEGSPATALPATPISPGTMRGPYQTSPGVGASPRAAAAPAADAPATGSPAPRAGTAANALAATAGGLGSAMREEVWAIVRAAVEEAVGPLVSKQRELEARLERAERERDAEIANRARAPQVGGAGTVVQGGGSSAVARLAAAAPALGAPNSPDAFSPEYAPSGRAARLDAPPASATNPGASTIPDLKVAGSTSAGAHPAGPRPSLSPTGYGVTVTRSMRPSLDLESVGPVDIAGFDGGARKRRVAGAVVVVMLLLIVGAVTMTVLSHG